MKGHIRTQTSHPLYINNGFSRQEGRRRRSSTTVMVRKEAEVELGKKKPRVLCLHGFRTSGEIMKTQVHKWPEHVLGRLDLVFPDAPYPAEGISDVEGIFPPPYYEWFQFNKEFTEYRNLEECFAHIEEYMIQHGPFDGLMGFSQGAILSSALPGLQFRGLALTRVPKIKFLIIIGGARFPTDDIAEKAYVPPLQLPSLHFLGETDFLRPHGTKLLEAFVDPVVVHHPKGHTVPRLDEKTEITVLKFIEKIQDVVHCDAVPKAAEGEQEAVAL